MSDFESLQDYAKAITSYVDERGWLDGFTPDAVIARQICMIFQEAGEAEFWLKWMGSDPAHFPPPKMIEYHIAASKMRDIGKSAFKDVIVEWNNFSVPNPDNEPEFYEFATEVADVLIPLMVLIETLRTEYGVDIFETAMNKVQADVQRGRK
jgi:hypothetical protein